MSPYCLLHKCKIVTIFQLHDEGLLWQTCKILDVQQIGVDVKKILNFPFTYVCFVKTEENTLWVKIILIVINMRMMLELACLSENNVGQLLSISVTSGSFSTISCL